MASACAQASSCGAAQTWRRAWTTCRPYFDSFAEYKEFCVQYRSKLSQIVRATAGWLPEQARIRPAREDSPSDVGCNRSQP